MDARTAGAYLRKNRTSESSSQFLGAHLQQRLLRGASCVCARVLYTLAHTHMHSRVARVCTRDGARTTEGRKILFE